MFSHLAVMPGILEFMFSDRRKHSKRHNHPEPEDWYRDHSRKRAVRR